MRLNVAGAESCVQAGFPIRVDSNSLSQPNARPPLPDFSAGVLLGGLVPVTNRSRPVRIRCGTPTWRLGPPGLSPEATGRSLQMVFDEQDQWPSGPPTRCLPVGSQIVNWIEPATSLPYGGRLAARAAEVPGQPTASYPTARWKPMCENPSRTLGASCSAFARQTGC